MKTYSIKLKIKLFAILKLALCLLLLSAAFILLLDIMSNPLYILAIAYAGYKVYHLGKDALENLIIRITISDKELDYKNLFQKMNIKMKEVTEMHEELHNPLEKYGPLKYLWVLYSIIFGKVYILYIYTVHDDGIWIGDSRSFGNYKEMYKDIERFSKHLIKRSKD